MYSLTPYLKSVLIGLLLGDGWIECRAENRSINARLGLKQSIIHINFALTVFNLFSTFCGSLPILTTGFKNGNIFHSISFKTRGLPCFTYFYSQFYVNKIKLIPADLLINFDAVAFAFWIMSDGSYEKGGLILCTDSFSLKDVCLLIGILHYKFSLSCTLRKTKNNQYRIYIRRSSMDILRNIVMPHMHPSFLYKIRKLD